MTQMHNLWRYNSLTEAFDLFWDCKSGLDKTPFTQENNPYSIIFVAAQRPTAVVSFAPVCNPGIDGMKKIPTHWGFGTCH